MMDLMLAAAVITALGLLPAATAAAVRFESARNPRKLPGTLRLAFWAVLQWAGVAVVLFFLPLAVLPQYIGLIISCLLVSFLFLAVLSRRREALDVLNESVRLLARRGGSLADMAEAFAHGDASVLAGRARRFADALRRGTPPAMAAARVRLPLDAETVLALEHRDESAWSTVGEKGGNAARPTAIPASAWPAASQAAYFFALLVTTVLISTFLMVWIVPTLQAMGEEFQIDTRLTHASDRGQLRLILRLPVLLAAALVVWSALQLVYWITDWRWIGRLLPLSGPLTRSRRRGDLLRGVAAAIEARNEFSQALQMVLRVRVRPGEKSRLRRAAAMAASGHSHGDALRRAGLVDASERVWIDAAEANGRLAEALRSIAGAAERRAQVRFESALAILFPMGILGCGLLILTVSHLVFGSLVEFIHAMV